MNYWVDVTDANGCTETAYANISEPSSALTYTLLDYDISCYGYDDGEIYINVSGGTPSYTYEWSNGDTLSYITGITVGWNTITVLDENGCAIVDSAFISEPSAIEINFSSDNVNCYGDSTGFIYAQVTGGTPTYIFVWSNQTYNDSLVNIPSGIYSLTITDINSCEMIDSVVVSQPEEPLGILLEATAVSCNSQGSGAVDATISGGTEQYSYDWSNGETSPGISGLNAGWFTLTVTDNYQCTAIDSVEVYPPLFLLSDMNAAMNYNGYDISCYGFADGLINVTVSQGTPPYNFNWSTGDTTQNLIDVSAGEYWLTITDQNSCITVDTILLIEPSVIFFDPIVDPPNCPGVENGNIILDISGGVSPYYFTWSNYETENMIVGLGAGNYDVTVTDANSCIYYYSFNLTNEFDECLLIPSVITPNGDGYNDEFKIRGIELYPETQVDIYNRWGQLLYRSDKGYHNRWDGTFNGKLMPFDTYFYVINLNDGGEPITGPLTLVK